MKCVYGTIIALIKIDYMTLRVALKNFTKKRIFLMPISKKNIKNIVVFDNEGETLDRYTIINKESGDMLTSSHHPSHPQGVGMFSCNINKDMKTTVKQFIDTAREDNRLGKKVKFDTVPEMVQNFIIDSFDLDAKKTEADKIGSGKKKRRKELEM
jgi:hypothetical protein